MAFDWCDCSRSDCKLNHRQHDASCERNLPGRFVDYDKPCTCELKDDLAEKLAIDKPEYELTVFGRNLSEIKKALDYWDEKKEYPYPIVVTQPTINELIDSAEQLLAWQPTCSLGSSGDLRQRRLRNALDRFKGVK